MSNINKLCTDCGGKLLECTLNIGMFELSVTVPEKYNFPKTFKVKAYMCSDCGRINLYADNEKGRKDGNSSSD